MKLKRLGSLLLCVVMIAMCVSCGSNKTTETTGTTSGVITIPTVESEKINLPLDEIANAIKINATPATQTQEIPLLIVLVNYDADGDGVDDYETGGEEVINATGEQWAGTDVEDHYELYFHGEKSLTNYYLEMTMGAFCFSPIQLDKVPEGSDITEGCLEVTVSIPHPGATGVPGLLDAQSTINTIMNATDEYIDYQKLDVNGNGKLDETEFACVILNSGIERSTGTSKDSRYPFQVHGTSQGLPGTRDGVTFSKVTNIGEFEYRNGTGNPPIITQIGTPAHELAHNLGAEDLYDTRRNGHSGDAVTGWPRAYSFSLQSNGNHLDKGASPAYLDPYQRIYLGWAEEKVVGDGVYTISSTTTNNYVVLRVNTPDPDEYYLVEIRLKTGFESALTSGTSKGGIMVWHIDEALNRRYFEEGSASTSTALNGVRHDPAIVPLFRTGYDSAGQYMINTTPADPFYYYDEADPSKAVFESGNFRSVTNGYQSFNSYPSSWTGDKNYNLRIEVLSAPGEEMTIKISGSQDGRKDFAPVVSADYSDKTHNMITVTGTIDTLNDANITECGIILSTDADFTENLVKKTATLDGNVFSATFEDLTPQTRYYYMVYVESDHGTALDTNDTTTNSAPKEQTYIKISLYRGISDPDRAYEVKVNFGEKLVVNSAVMKNDGYTFEGWYYDEALTKPYDINTVIEKGTEPFALYAKWSKD